MCYSFLDDDDDDYQQQQQVVHKNITRKLSFNLFTMFLGDHLLSILTIIFVQQQQQQTSHGNASKCSQF